MARTLGGVEFFLARVRPGEQGQVDPLLGVLERAVRAGDSVFTSGEDIYIALVGTALQAGRAVKRLLAITKKEGFEAKVTLVAEPFPPEIMEAAGRVIVEELSISTRREASSSERRTP